MVNISKSSFIKSSALKTGDIIEFLEEGRWVDKDFSKEKDGSEVKNVFETLVMVNNSEKGNFIINRTSLDNIANKYSCNTENWVGKRAKVGFVDMVAFGKRTKVLCLEPETNVNYERANEIFKGTASKSEVNW